jgi:hypothetical protein
MYDWLVIATILTALYLIVLTLQDIRAREEAKPVRYLGEPSKWHEQYPDPDEESLTDELCPACRRVTMQKWIGPFLEHRSQNLWIHHKRVAQWKCNSCGYRSHASLDKYPVYKEVS